MVKKILSRKRVVLIGVPLFALFIQGFVRFVLKTDFNTIGITLGSIGLGQLLPFMHFDHFVANKLLGTKAKEVKVENVEVRLLYKVESGVNLDIEKIETTKSLFTWAIITCLGLFFIIVYLGIRGYVFWHIFLGSVICIVAWYLLIFRND